MGKKTAPTTFLLLAAILFSAISALPIGYLVIKAFGAGSRGLEIIFRPSTFQVLINSIGLATSVTLSAILIGVSIAWLTVRTDLPFRNFWATITPLPLALPSYVGAFTLIAALGPRGMIQKMLEPWGIETLPSIYGFKGAWLALTLFTYPYVLLCARSGLRDHDPSLEEAARSLGQNSRRIFWEITLPNLRPSILAGGLLVALYSLSDFGVVSMLQFNSFTRKIYLQYTSSFDRNAAALLALMLVLLTLVILIVEIRLRGKARYYRCAVGSIRPLRVIRLGIWRIPALFFCSFIVLISLVLPLTVIGFWFYRGIMNGEDLFAGVSVLLNSIGVSGIAALISVVVAFPIVFIAVRRPDRISTLIERSAYLGHALPGIVIALSLVFFGIHCVPVLYQTLFMLIFAYIIRFLPEAIGSLRPSMIRIHPNLEEAARNLGQTQTKAIKSITLPLLKPGIFTGVALVFLTCLKELPATLLLSPTGFQTLATRIWGATEEAFYTRAAAPALLLVLVAALSMSFIVSQTDKEVYG